jgi:protein-disulfide isomerase
MQDQSPDRKVTITLSRDNIINGVLALQLVLLVVFGWQLFSIKSQLGGSGTVAKNPVRAALPTEGSGDTLDPNARQEIVVTTDDHMIGGKDAKVTIVEYSDFECPFCSRAYPTVKQVMDTYGDDVRLVYRHYPLSFHPQAQKAAEASECAADQGKFWEFHDLVFANQDLLQGGLTQMKKWAADLKLNTGKFNSCLDSGEKADKVLTQMNEGSALGVSGTPGFFINGVSVVGAQPFSTFKQIIDQELGA